MLKPSTWKAHRSVTNYLPLGSRNTDACCVCMCLSAVSDSENVDASFPVDLVCTVLDDKLCMANFALLLFYQ